MLYPKLNLTTIIFPTNLNSIGERSFSGCIGLTSITIPNSVTSIGIFAFTNCSGLTSLAISNSVKSINEFAFTNCGGLTGILVIPNSVTLIGAGTFSGCIGLTGLVIPNSVTSIEEEAFLGCTGFTSIYANSITPLDLSLSTDVFRNVNKTICTLYVPLGSKSAYQTANQWKDFTNKVENATTSNPTINNASVNLYPNPTTNNFQVSGFNGIALISVKDLNGKTLLSKQINNSDKININSLSKGIYTIEVNSNEGSIIKKIIKN